MTIYFVSQPFVYALSVAGVVAEHVKITNTVLGLPYRTSHLIVSSHIGNPQFNPETCLIIPNALCIMGPIPSNSFMHNLLSPVS